MENSKATDVVSGGLIARPASSENAHAMGKFTFECYDKDGNLKWAEESQNKVVNVGLQYMAGTALDGTTTRITTWFVGLKNTGTPAASDTYTSHGTWTENTTYSDAARPAAVFVAPSATDPAVVTNAASKAVFNINGSTTIYGAFLSNDSTKGGTTGAYVLFSASDFTGGSRAVVNGDTLQVTYQFSLAAT